MYTKKFTINLLKKRLNAFNAVKVGNPLDPATQMGSQIDAKQVAKIASLYCKCGSKYKYMTNISDPQLHDELSVLRRPR